VLIAAITASAVFGIMQIVGGSSGSFYPYVVPNISTRGLPLGLLANRNHQALFLAIGIPLLRLWTLDVSPGRLPRGAKNAIALGLARVFSLTVLVTGSRTGLVLLFLGFVAAFAIDPRLGGAGRGGRFNLYLKAFVALGFVGLLGLALALGRAASVERFFGFGGGEGDLRLGNTPAMLDLFLKQLPFGSGFGSFDPVFRGVEPDLLLRPTFFNNAHNDLLEVAITGGVPALIVIALFLAWWGRASWRVFSVRSPSYRGYVGRAASLAILIALVASLTDYPLRTPLLGAVFALLCAMLAEAQSAVARTQATVATSPERL
jgi:hypothetical protein